MARFTLHAKGPLEALLRLAGLMLVMGLVVFAFWKNSERNMERLNARFGLSDETKSLSPDERDHVQAFIASLRKEYGIEARVQVTRTRPQSPEADGKTLYVGLCPDEKSAVVQLPPLMARALGADFSRMLVDEHFPFHFAAGKSWQKGLLLALDLMQSRLATLSAAQETPAPGTPGGDKDTK
ncbi:MAG: hypothetical protein Q8O35_10375 [Humidesulfovibrio sp.]|uniref:hypothetical protein n=1 Tax=Humidesulfovibrio sp. TaxID=2910988 RepID=UPI00273334EA|nr:hypothetical protein [Humidesulfovibrio sp.]MDP2848581.1 hypothetical protein [Humidesulfovibrio sp.]